MRTDASGRGQKHGLLGLLVTVLAAGLAFDGAKFPGIPFPANSLIAGALVVVAFSRQPARLDTMRWFTPAMLGLIAWLLMDSAFVSGVTHIDFRRALSVFLWAVFAIAVGAGRIPMKLLGAGLAIGLATGTLFGIATLPSSGYAGRLTGVFGDPNTAGLILLTFGCLALAVIDRIRVRWIVGVIALGGIYLTLSRTTFLATAAVFVWLLVGKRVSRWIGGAAVVGIVWWATTFGGDGLSADQFASRAGSDELRQKIMDASQAAVDVSPWLGHGLGTAHVNLDIGTFFFHSSYLSLRQEGGWAALIIFMMILIPLFLALTRLPRERRNAWIEASFIGIAICATNLGETFLRIPTALALGFAIWHLGVQRREMREQLPKGRVIGARA